jgi:formylglycine-generating enzyme required for sulfatase activity
MRKNIVGMLALFALPSIVGGCGSPESGEDQLSQLNTLFDGGEANTAWDTSFCTETYKQIAQVSDDLSRRRLENKTLQADARTLNLQAKAMLPNCDLLGSDNPVPNQLDTRFLRADMQIWKEQLAFDQTNPDNAKKAAGDYGKGTRVDWPDDGSKSWPNDGYKFLQLYRDCSNAYCPTFVALPQGVSEIGATAEEKQEFDISPIDSAWESPRHQVRIYTPFGLTDKEVTRDQFAEFIRETGYTVPGGCVTSPDEPIPVSSDPTAPESSAPAAPESSDPESPAASVWNTTANWENPGFVQSGQDPVVCVSRSDAENFAVWLSKKTGAKYRLPSEAEWEYAARAFTTKPYIWGSDLDEICANAAGYDTRTDEATDYKLPKKADCDDGAAYTNKTGSYKPNEWGLYDLAGNVREWVSDSWEPNLSSGPTSERPRTSGVQQFPVQRGGGWNDMPQNLRNAYRSAYYSHYIRSYSGGFRLVREI